MVSDSGSLLLYCVIMHESVFVCGRALFFIIRLEAVGNVAGKPGASSSQALVLPIELAPDVI